MTIVSTLLALALAAPAAPAPAATEAKAERKICKREETSVSRMAKKICMTADQWRAQQRGGSGGVPAGASRESGLR